MSLHDTIAAVDLLVIPRRIDYDGQTASMSGEDRKRFLSLVDSAREGLNGHNLQLHLRNCVFL